MTLKIATTRCLILVTIMLVGCRGEQDAQHDDQQQVENKVQTPDTQPVTPIQITAHFSSSEPQGFFYIADRDSEPPAFVSIKFRGDDIVNSKQYGNLKLEIHDNQSRPVVLQKAVKGKFEEDLANEMVDLNHFFLESPDTLSITAVVDRPSPDVTDLALKGSIQIKRRDIIVVDDILQKLNRPLVVPELRAPAELVVTFPEPDQTDVEGSLAVKFVGDPEQVEEFEILRGDGYMISTGGVGRRRDDGFYMIRWAGQELPRDTRLRLVLSDNTETVTIPFAIQVSISED